MTLLVLVLWGLGTAVLVGEPVPDCAEVTCDPVDFNAADLELARELDLPTGVLTGPLPALIAALPGLLVFVIAGVIFWRRSNDWMALLVSFTLVYIAGVLFTSSNDAVDRTYPGLDPVMGVVFVIGIVSLGGLFYLFPDGRFVPRWTIWVGGSSVAVPLLYRLLPVASDVDEIVRVVAALALLGSGVYSQVYRYRRVSAPLQRQQTKWVVFGGLMSVIAIMVVWSIVAGLFPPEEPSASRIYALLVVGPVLTILLIPVSFAISILRYRLWDIDILVNRALAYGVLSAVIVGAYVGGVLLFQAAFRAATGQESTVALVASTLVIAALFQPLRRGVQGLIDRRFYRRRYDAARTLAAFSATARDEVNLERLSDALVGVVQETMQPAHVSLWLREGSHEQPGRGGP